MFMCTETQSVFHCSELRYQNISNLPKCALGQPTGQKEISFNKAGEVARVTNILKYNFKNYFLALTHIATQLCFGG